MSDLQVTAAPVGRSTITLDDFMTGLLAGLADRGVRVVSIRDNSFYSAVEDAFKLLEERAAEFHLDLLFFVSRSRLYGDSPDIRDGITRAVQRDLVSLDNPEYLDMRLKIGRLAAPKYLASLPGNPTVYRDVADRFLEHFPNYI